MYNATEKVRSNQNTLINLIFDQTAKNQLKLI